MENTNTTPTTSTARAVFTVLPLLTAADSIRNVDAHVEVQEVYATALTIYLWASGFIQHGKTDGLTRAVETHKDGLAVVTALWDKAADAVYASMRPGQTWVTFREGVDDISAFVTSMNALMELRRYDELMKTCERYYKFVKAGMPE